MARSEQPTGSARRTKGSKLTARTQARTISALALRAEGLSFEAIGQKLNCHRGTAWRRVVAEMQAAAYESKEAADDLLSKEWAITELLLDKAMELVEAGDVNGIRAAIRILDRRARYRGLDAPKKIQAELAASSGFMTKEQMLAEVLDRLKNAGKK